MGDVRHLVSTAGNLGYRSVDPGGKVPAATVAGWR